MNSVNSMNVPSPLFQRKAGQTDLLSEEEVLGGEDGEAVAQAVICGGATAGLFVVFCALLLR